MKNKDTIEMNKNQMPFISLLLGIALVATATAYILYRSISNRAYKKKWQEYDECGLA